MIRALALLGLCAVAGAQVKPVAPKEAYGVFFRR